jgi:hypothetical protein
MDHRSHARNNINKVESRRKSNRDDRKGEEKHRIFMEFARHFK